MTTTASPQTRRGHQVDLPAGQVGSVELRTITVEPHSIENLLAGYRATTPGEYTALYRNGQLWMSDTDAEWRDHLDCYFQIRRRGGRVLVNGLGLGMIVRAALDLPNVEHVDVVEIDADVAALVGPHYEGPRCTVHVTDAYDIQWPPGTRWTVAWHDIWPDLCEDNLPEMARLHRKYGRRVDWQASWGKELLQAERRRTANAWWR